MSFKVWNPKNFLNLKDIKNGLNYALIVLNRPILANKDLVESLWNHGENHFKTYFLSDVFNL